MSWSTDNAVKRIFNSFKRLKNQIFEQDIEALKLLNQELINSQKNYVNDNMLLLKLLAIHLKTEVDHFKDINFAKKNIGKALSLPVGHHIELLRMSLNEIDLSNYLNSIGLEHETFDWSKQKQIKDLAIIKDNEKQMIEKLKKNWSFENVEQSIYNTTNEFLKDINNYN